MNLEKACDFCYVRKIKCDFLKPRCTNCVTYGKDCRHGAPSRHYKPKSQRRSAKTDDSSHDLQARIAHLENLLEQAIGTPRSSHGTSSESEIENQQLEPASYADPSATAMMYNLYTEKDKHPSRAFQLPPQQQVLPLVHWFIHSFNAVLPLFHPHALLRLVHDVYRQSPRQRDPVEWAAINVVIGITHRRVPADSNSDKKSIEHLNRAQSVLSDIVLGETTLLNIQVLLGIVMLLEGSEDLRPALVLIATTLRLAHGICMHDRLYSAPLDAALAQQRAHVFWIAYILEKDLSLRAKQPSMLLDDDIDLDLPGEVTSERQLFTTIQFNAGTITSIDGTYTMDYFRTRVQLAVIEGGVYDYLMSTRSQKRTPEERACALESVARAIEEWKSSIPPEFSSGKLLRTAPPETLWFFCRLYSTSLMCTTFVNQANVMNVPWVTSLRQNNEHPVLPLPPDRWDALVREARNLLILFRQIGHLGRYNWWLVGCASDTAMVILIANRIYKPQHVHSDIDRELVDEGIQTLESLVQETDSKLLQEMRDKRVSLQKQANDKADRWMSVLDFQYAGLDTRWPQIDVGS